MQREVAVAESMPAGTYTEEQMQAKRVEANTHRANEDSRAEPELAYHRQQLGRIPHWVKMAFYPAYKESLINAARWLGRMDLAQFPRGAQIAEGHVYQP